MARMLWLEALAALRLRDYAGAERAGRRSVELMSQIPVRTPLQALERREVPIPHALALARLGRHAEARAALSPLTQHYSKPDAMGDVVTEAVTLAWVEYTEALATPERAAALLAQAGRRVDALPAEMKRMKTVARLREDIAREAAVRR